MSIMFNQIYIYIYIYISRVNLSPVLSIYQFSRLILLISIYFRVLISLTLSPPLPPLFLSLSLSLSLSLRSRFGP